MLHHRHGTQTGSDSYRYAFQGQEKDDEIKGEGNSYNYTYRMHDPRIGRFFAVDPLAPKYPHNSPYAFSENKVIAWGELEGLESYYAARGEYLGCIGNSTEVRVVSAEYIEQKGGIDKTVENIQQIQNGLNSGFEASTDHFKYLNNNASTLLPITHEEFQKLAGLVSKEDHTNQETMNATAYAQKNRYDAMNEGDKSATVTEVFNTFGGSRGKDLHSKMLKNRPLYKKYWELSGFARNSEKYGGKTIYVMAQSAVINAWLHPENDNTNGATGWHGLDVLRSMPEVGHAYEDFQLNYGFEWSKDALIGKGAIITSSNMPNHKGANGRVLYEISAAYGSSIFYKEKVTQENQSVSKTQGASVSPNSTFKNNAIWGQ